LSGAQDVVSPDEEEDECGALPLTVVGLAEEAFRCWYSSCRLRFSDSSSLKKAAAVM
jgi:hypothetical protein